MSDDYIKARREGQRAYRRAVARGRYPYLPALENMVEGTNSYPERYLGMKEIPLSMIVGTRTKGRQNAFAANFMPLLEEKSEFAVKWSALYKAQKEEGIRDPIKVYEFMNRFYVQEGNKRVSVLKYAGAYSIYAEVTRILPFRAGGACKEEEAEPLRIYREFLDFYNVTKIFEITFSKPGSYLRLAKLMGHNLREEWEETDVRRLRASFYLFQKDYEDRGGLSLDITAGDAYMIYAGVFGIESLLQDDSMTIRNRIMRLWSEYRSTGPGTVSTGEDIHLLEEPESSVPEKKHESLAAGMMANTVSAVASTVSAAEKVTSTVTAAAKGAVEVLVRKPRSTRAAFLFDKGPEGSSWSYYHALGMNEAQEALGESAEFISFTDCGRKETIRKAFEAAASDEEDIVFALSPSMMEECLRAAILYPDMRIMNCSIWLPHHAVPTYHARMYEAKFVMGCLAGELCENHRIGYRADYPIYGVTAEINAFALGASMMDPKAEIHLVWGGRGKNCDQQLHEQGCRIIMGPDAVRPGENTRRFGLYKVEEDGSITSLGVPVYRWGRYYERLIAKLRDGSLDANLSASRDYAVNFWWGMSAGMVDVILSDRLPYQAVRTAELMKRMVASQSLFPFEGPIRKQGGTEETQILAAGQTLSNHEIITMDWLCDNVIGDIPKAEKLDACAREMVETSGVRAEDHV